MGSGSYSSISRAIRSQALGYQTKSIHEIFTENHLNEGMSPANVTLRESRDSIEHPNSIAIIIALDVTGSMGYIPQELIRDGLPTIMSNIIEHGNPDPQVMFLAIGDHKCDEAPLQISQFESSDELLDHWLQKVYLEEGGGGNGGESYSLAHYFAAYHTSIDCFEKRAEKGFLFTVGDDKTHKNYPKDMLKSLMQSSEESDHTSAELIHTAQEKYNVYHIHVSKYEASTGTKSSWKELLGDHFIDCPDYHQLANVISRIVTETKSSVKKSENVENLNNNPENGPVIL